MVDHELNELRREFLVEARQKVDEMESVAADSQNRESLERLAYLAHQLKGSGGSYGYQRISTDAAELEKAVESFNTTSPPDSNALGRYLADLRSAIDRAVSELE